MLSQGLCCIFLFFLHHVYVYVCICMYMYIYMLLFMVHSLSRVRLFATPWTAAPWVSLSFTISWSLFKLMSTELVMPSNHLILCHPFLFFPQSFPASETFPMSQRFTSGGQCGQSIRASSLASVLPMNIQGWFPLGLTSLISLLTELLSRVFSSTTFWKHQFFRAQPSVWSNSHIHRWLLEKP